MKTFSRVHNNIFVLNEINESNSRVGKCYELAGRYVSDHPDSVLIHGKLINPFSKGMSEVEHAWVEEGNEIFDPVMDKRFPKHVYQSLFKVEEYNRYSYHDVHKMTSHHGHWGPWS